MFYEIDLRMFKNVYKSSTKILQIGSCGKFQPHWLHVSCSRNAIYLRKKDKIIKLLRNYYKNDL
jgi:hypothetical protein